jgi:hypothetical protein
MVTIVERLAMQIRSGPVRAIFPQPGNEKRRCQVINHEFLSAAAELFTASLRRLGRAVPLAHE